MTKFERGNFLGEKTIEVLTQELYSLLNSYTPSTMTGDEQNDFNRTLKSISVDYEKFGNMSFNDEFTRIVKRFQKSDPNYVSPVLP